MIKYRGAVELSTDVVGESDLIEYLLATPYTPATVPDRPPHETFQWLKVGERVLVPRYCDLMKHLLKTKSNRDSVQWTEPCLLHSPDTMFVWNKSFPLREKQVPGAEQAEATLRRRRGCIIKGKTGSGKTVVGLNMIYRLQPRHVLILVDQIDIAAQWAERITQFLPGAWPEFLMQKKDIKTIRSKLTKPSILTPGRITIATAQSLYSSSLYTYHEPMEADMLVCDEVHVFSAPTFLRSIFKVNFGYSVGLTATDDRKDRLEHVFRDALGRTTIEFEGEVMDPVVYKLKAPSAGFRDRDWTMEWCRRFRQSTWQAKCRQCQYADQFPRDCGGHLPVSKTGKVSWGGMQNRSGLISAWSTHPMYLEWMQALIEQQVKRGRRIFFFAENRVTLITLYQWSVKKFGTKVCGIFLGKGKAGPDEPDFTSQRETALRKQLTFATYGVAQKALDVKEKDCAILATPISDGRQVIGRVRRAQAGKKTPIVIVPVPPNIGSFNGSWMKLRKQCEAEGWTIKS